MREEFQTDARGRGEARRGAASVVVNSGDGGGGSSDDRWWKRERGKQGEGTKGDKSERKHTFGEGS